MASHESVVIMARINYKGQALWEVCILIVIIAGGAFGFYAYGQHKYNLGYKTGYAQSTKDRPTYTVENGGQLKVENECKGFGLHIFKGVLGWSY